MTSWWVEGLNVRDRCGARAHAGQIHERVDCGITVAPAIDLLRHLDDDLLEVGIGDLTRDSGPRIVVQAIHSAPD